MIDLHCHILPGLDDGPKSMDEALQMCLLSYRDGVRRIVATPHIKQGVYENDRLGIINRVVELNEVIKNQSPEVDLQVFPGADVHFHEGMIKDLENGTLVTVGDGGKFLFVEFPFQGIPFGAEEVLFQLLVRGMVPIITHPERILDILKDFGRYENMIRMGCLGQVTAMSLTGGFGSRIMDVAERLLKKGLLHLIASDAHSLDGRPPLLSNALKRAERIVGKQEAQRMVTEYPQAILEGRRPDISEPI